MQPALRAPPPSRATGSVVCLPRWLGRPEPANAVTKAQEVVTWRPEYNVSPMGTEREQEGTFEVTWVTEPCLVLFDK